MERQRVVHYAKTNTAKVLRPGLSNRLASSQAPELSTAPLASIDSDFVVITKRRDETNMAPNLWERLRNSVPQTDCKKVQAISDDSIQFDKEHFYGELSDYAPPRTYVRLRSSPNKEFQEDISNSVGDKKLKFIDVRQNCLQRFRTSNINNDYNLTTTSKKSISTSTCDKQSVLLHDIKNQPKFDKQQRSYGKESKLQNVVHKTNSQQTTTSKTLPLVSNKVSVSTRQPDQTASISNIISENSSHILASSLNSKVGHHVLHKGNPNGQFSNSGIKQSNITAETNHQKVINTEKSQQDSLKHHARSEKIESQPQVKSSLISTYEDNCSGIRPQNIKCIQMDEETLRELHSISASEYTSNLRQTSERISRMYTTYASKLTDSKNCHFLDVNTQFCSSVPEDKKDACMGLQENTNDFQSQAPKNVNTINQGIDYDDIKDGKHQREVPTENSESTLCYKRNSLKVATRCSSIPDLTRSFEYFDVSTRKVANADSISNCSKNFQNLKNKIPEPCPEITISDHQGLGHTPSVISRSYGTSKSTSKVISNEDSLFSSVDRKLHSQASSLDRNDIKHLSFRLASAGIPDVWLLERDFCKHPDNRNGNKNNISNAIMNSTSGRYLERQFLTDKLPGTHSGKDNESHTSGITNEQCSKISNENLEEEVRKLKRRSFMLATRSMSDLTLLEEDDDDDDFRSLTHSQSIKLCNKHNFKDISTESVTSGIFTTPESQVRGLRVDNLSSSHLNSSFGSFYSCQSHNSAKTNLTQPIYGKKENTQASIKKVQKNHQLKNEKACEIYSDSDSSISHNASVSYTTSDKHFLTSRESSNTIPCMRHTILRSPLHPLPGQLRLSSSNQSQQGLQSKVDESSVASNYNTMSSRGQPPRRSNSRVTLHCQGCGVKDGLSAHDQYRRRKNGSRCLPNRSRIWVHPEYAHGRPCENRKRSKSAPSSKHAQQRHPDTHLNHVLPFHRQIHAEPKLTQNSLSSYAGALDSSISSSLTSILDSTWESAPRIPPSLGRPRRKLYAGFDSQPLPMDSILSDSSSVYSTQSCSSWGTSKSATVESNSKISEVSSKARSASSISSIIVTPTRYVSQDEVFDFFSYTDKRSSLNNHNLFLNSGNSFQDTCLYDKTYSKDSLESVLSNDTTVNIEHNFSTDSSYIKSPLNFEPYSTYSDNNNEDIIGNEHRFEEMSNLEKSNNRCGLEFGSKFYNNGNFVQAEPNGNSLHPLKTLKALSSASLPRPKFLTKRKYFSSKDILDLVMTSEKNDKISKKRSKSLERQAQKMCEVVLCLS